MSWLVGLTIALALLAGACSGPSDASPVVASPTVVASATPIELPRFVAATGPLAELVGTPFDPAMLPPELGGDTADLLGGGVILNPSAEEDVESLAMHWVVEDTYANFIVSARDQLATDENLPWTVVSASTLELGPDMVVTVGTNVCMAPIHTYDWQHGEFLAVTNLDQNVALGAWTMTATGPTPYAELESLVCERFVP